MGRFWLTEPKFYFEWEIFRNWMCLFCIGGVILVWINFMLVNQSFFSHKTFSFDSIIFSIGMTLWFICWILEIKATDFWERIWFHMPKRRPWRSPKKVMKIWWMTSKRDIAEKLFVIALSACLFLPVRLLYYNYVSKFFGFNLGILSIITIVMFVLIKYNKIGWVGKVFHSQTIKLTTSKWTKRVILGSIAMAFFYGGQLWSFDYYDNSGNFCVKAMKETLQYYLSSGTHAFSQNPDNPNYQPDMSILSAIDPYTFSLMQISTPYFFEKECSFMDSKKHPESFLLGFYFINTFSFSWYSHFNAIMFAEEIEGFGLFFFDRRMYRTLGVKGEPWKKYGFENFTREKLRRLVYH